MKNTLTLAERADLENISAFDDLPISEYTIRRGPLSGHAFADNGYGMVRDLTDALNIEADTNSEADLLIGSKEHTND